MKKVTAQFSDESLLLGKLRENDAVACRFFVEKNIQKLRAISRRYLKNDTEADDAVQESFLQAFRAIEKFEGRSSLSTWLHRITVNQCLMRLRSRPSQGEDSIEALQCKFEEDGHRIPPQLQTQSGVAEKIEASERTALVQDAIAKLPDKYRAVLMARDMEELSTSETASSLSISEADVKTTLHRARAALKTLLDPFLDQII